MEPNLTPLQALQACQEKDNFTQDGWEYYLDGPQGSPRNIWAPFAIDEKGQEWFVNGEPGDIVTNTNYWIKI